MIKVKTKVKLFPAIGKFVKGAYVKLNDPSDLSHGVIFKIEKVLEFDLIVNQIDNSKITISKRDATLHKVYVTSKSIIAELNYIDCDKIDINQKYEFEITSTLTRARIGDIVKIHKVKLCNFLYNDVKVGIVTDIFPNGEYKIILNDDSEMICKRHMFKCENDVKYIAKLWTS